MQNIDVLLEPVRGLLLQIGAFLPRVALAAAILAIGWLLAKGLRLGMVKALRALNFHVLTERAGIDGFVQQGGSEHDTTDRFGWLVYALVILASLIIASNSLGLSQVTDLLGRVMLLTSCAMVAGMIPLALGLGARERAAQLIERWFPPDEAVGKGVKR